MTVTRATQQTLILIKPDGVRRGLTTKILSRFERCGLKLVALDLRQIDREFASRHYTYEDIAVRHGEKVREQLLDYITSGPVAVCVVQGYEAVAVVRKICGPTEPTKAPPGTIRGDFCHHGYGLCDAVDRAIHNVIHASASEEEAETEIQLWFDDVNLVQYRRADDSEHLLDVES